MKSYSVTQVLGVFADFDKIRPDVLEEAQRRGTAVHNAAAAHALGLWSNSLPEIWQGYFKSFRNWFDKYVAEVIFVEERFHDDIFYFHGKPDLGAKLIDGRFVIPDYKTPVTEYPTWKSQVAAYRHLAHKKYDYNFECMSLRLDKNGGPAKAAIYRYSDDDFAAFLSALNAYRYFKG